MSQPIVVGSTFGADGRFTCILPYVDFLRPAFGSRVAFDSMQVEVHAAFARECVCLSENRHACVRAWDPFIASHY